MANYDFNKDLVIGNKGEDVVLNDLISLGAKVLVKRTDNNKYDFMVSKNGKNITYECKTDFFPDTGNLFVETKCRGKESGINVTKADWFATYFTYSKEIWYIKTSDLKDLIESVPHKKTTNAGDKGSGTEGYLINKAKFKNNFIIRKAQSNLDSTNLSLAL
jgi:hypothetical protein